MKDFKKYAAVAGLSAAITAATMSFASNKFEVGENGNLSNFEGLITEEEQDKVFVSQTESIESQKVKGDKQVLSAYNDYLKKNNGTDEFTLDELEYTSDMKKFIKVRTASEEKQNILLCTEYKLYRLNNDRLVALNPIKNEKVIDILTGEEIIITENTDLIPICDVKSFIEDFEIPLQGYDFNKVALRDEELSTLTPDILKQKAFREIGLLLKVYNAQDILDKYEELKAMNFTEQTLAKYNSCLKKYGQSIKEEDLALISSEFNDVLEYEICLTKDDRTSIYDKNIINLIYSENGTSIVIAKIDEVNGQEVSPNFANIFNSIDIDPVGYVVDRGIHIISDSKKEELKAKYGEGILEAIERYGLPVVTYDTNEICQKYNEYKQEHLFTLKK